MEQYWEDGRNIALIFLKNKEKKRVKKISKLWEKYRPETLRFQGGKKRREQWILFG